MQSFHKVSSFDSSDVGRNQSLSIMSKVGRVTCPLSLTAEAITAVAVARGVSEPSLHRWTPSQPATAMLTLLALLLCCSAAVHSQSEYLRWHVLAHRYSLYIFNGFFFGFLRNSRNFGSRQTHIGRSLIRSVVPLPPPIK